MRKAIFIFIAVILVAVSIDWIHSCADLKSHKEVFGRYLTYADMYEYKDKDYDYVVRVPSFFNAQPDSLQEEKGRIIVIENVFHYKQTLHLRMGDNVIGRYQKGNPINTPIETVDPSVDLNHCVLNVSRDKRGQLKYVLRDGNSNTGTFVDNVEILPPERRVIGDGTLFTIGATSIILRAAETDESPA